MASKENFRGAAAGLFFAGVILAGINYLQPTSNGQSSVTSVIANDINAEEAMAFLEEKGFTTLSSEEYEQLTEQQDDLTDEINTLISQIDELEQSQNDRDGNDAEDTYSDSSDSDSGVIYNSVLTISSGMTTQDISEQLVSLNIIDDADELTTEIFDRELAELLQIGEFTLDSEMSINEIVEKITSS